MHHGQICFSTERIIVLESVAEHFIPLLKKAADVFAPGSGVSQDMVSKAYASLVEAEDKGATFLLGGPEYVQPAQLRPTIVTGVTEDMTLFDTESFGPSVSLYIAKDEEEAIMMANNSTYGLNASVHSTDMYRALRVGQRLEVGQVHVNSLTTYNEGMSVGPLFAQNRD
jgi:acyl-CoA reductase-like NAD-dependent aldehyde dehydrogenase